MGVISRLREGDMEGASKEFGELLKELDEIEGVKVIGANIKTGEGGLFIMEAKRKGEGEK